MPCKVIRIKVIRIGNGLDTRVWTRLIWLYMFKTLFSHNKQLINKRSKGSRSPTKDRNSTSIPMKSIIFCIFLYKTLQVRLLLIRIQKTFHMLYFTINQGSTVLIILYNNYIKYNVKTVLVQWNGIKIELFISIPLNTTYIM